MIESNDSNGKTMCIIVTIVQIALFVLKIAGIWDIPWGWVLAPIWIPLVLLLIICVLGLIILRIEDKSKGE